MVQLVEKSKLELKDELFSAITTKLEEYTRDEHNMIMAYHRPP